MKKLKKTERAPWPRAGRTVVLGLALLLCWAWVAAFPDAGQEPKLAISFKFSGSLNYLLDGGGDLEKTRKGMEDYFVRVRSEGYWKSADFDWKRLELQAEPRLEMMIHVGSRLGLALGTEYILTSTRGDYGLYYDSTRNYWSSVYSRVVTDDYVRQYKISAVPIKFDIYYALPLSSSGIWRAEGHAGVGYYFGRLTHQLTYAGQDESRHYYSSSYYSYFKRDHSSEMTEEARCQAWGIQGGLGLSFNPGRVFSIGAEVTGRYVNFNNWKGDSASSEKIIYDYGYGGYSYYQEKYEYIQSAHGHLWTYEAQLSQQRFCAMGIFDREPASSSLVNVRKSAINLNALGVQFFVRFRFDLI